MAVKQSTQITRIDAHPRATLPVQEHRGKFRVARFDFTQAGAGAIGDDAELCELPAGARILGGQSYIRSSAGSALETMSVGTRAHTNVVTGDVIPENATRFGTGIACNATPAFNTFASFNGAMAGDTDSMLGKVRVFIRFAGAGPPNGQKFTGEIIFVVD